MSGQTRSPIKDKPLRLPGQSLDEAKRKLFEDKVETPFVLALFFTLLAAMEWWRYLTEKPPNPVVFSVAAGVMIAFVAWRIWRVFPQIRAIKQGAEGEKVVGQFLERLREDGYQVFHDLIGTGFNVDHVLIGPTGVFTIETKTWSKPIKGDANIVFNGDSLVVAGREPERNPVVQAKAQASWVRQILSESTGKTYEVIPVLVFPGWFIKCEDKGASKVLALEPKALPGFLNKMQRKLNAEDVKLASFHLSRYIRSCERERSA